MRKLKLTALCFFCFFVFVETASACVCTGGVPTVLQAFNEADVVFSGRFIVSRNFKALFIVDKSWKGVNSRRIYLLNSNTDCDINFRKTGRRWLIYASRIQLYKDAEGKIPLEVMLVITSCGRSTQLINAKEDLKQLGEGKIPINKVQVKEHQKY